LETPAAEATASMSSALVIEFPLLKSGSGGRNHPITVN